MEWAKSKSVDEIGARGEKLREKKIQGIGNKTVTVDGKVESIGAGGWGGGVHLALSDEETQKKNKAMLEAMFRRERKRRRKEMKESEQQEKQRSDNNEETS